MDRSPFEGTDRFRSGARPATRLAPLLAPVAREERAARALANWHKRRPEPEHA